MSEEEEEEETQEGRKSRSRSRSVSRSKSRSVSRSRSRYKDHSDWSTQSLLASDWSTQLILNSDWSTQLIMRSDWLISCRAEKIMFYAGDIFGFYGFSFMDLVSHEYVQEVTETKESDEPAAKKQKTMETETKSVKKAMAFVSMAETLKVSSYWSR